MEVIDLRSDTVTKPTEAMRKAMAEAPVGDDVYGEDPTVNLLQEKAAHLLGKDAALFVPSGTMGNLASILAHCKRGDEVILGKLSHTYLYEGGGISALGGVHSCQIPNQADGSLDLEDIRSAVRSHDAHQPITRLIVLENTHNRCGGAVLDVEYIRSVGQLADEYGLSLHIDGARLFNAAVALEVPARDLVEAVDSVTFCLSKALCAPVGSVICGSSDFIQQAHRMRKHLGGGMRQAGILAAAGIVALDTMVGRLAEDHVRASNLAYGLSALPGLTLPLGYPQSNMIFPELADHTPINAREMKGKLSDEGILVGAVGARRMRLVTHYWIDDAMIDRTIEAFDTILRNVS
jgi:threonine aldolase